MSAPVCHIPPENAGIPQPSPAKLPGIPAATDLASALAAINAMRQTLQIITGQFPPEFGNGFGRTPDPNSGKSQWTEQSRKTSTVKIYQNNDPSTGNFVEVEQINQLTMADKKTGQKWTWDRERS